MPKSQRTEEFQVNSDAVEARARYSVSVEDRENVCCLLADHKTTLDPNRTQKPEVERCVSLQPAQSLSL